MPYGAFKGSSLVIIMVYFICPFSLSLSLPPLPSFLPLPSLLALFTHFPYAQPLKVFDAVDHWGEILRLRLHFALPLVLHWVCLPSTYPLGADFEV